ncbi:MAG: dITP/XTP pyrophosphatase [Candidatus Celerinatantimonas neptuna]|nr:MAG: dITP/XTP pyrophosphatase [Candidatus Celerinatantimonas neptuna]
MTKIVLATSNQGKVAELQSILTPHKMTVVPQSQFNVTNAEETGTTFVENAIIKARHAATTTGLPAIADDSGLTVDALDGAPGIYSARFSGPSATDQTNIEKLLEKLKNTSDENRQASFHCVLVYLKHADDPTPLICHGQWHGRIAHQCHGSNGFGYDPIFYPNGMSITSAELKPAEKNKVSHRGQALDQLIKQFTMLK